MLRFFEHNNYVDILKEVLAENAETRGYQSQLAKAAGCHTSHLSHVVSGRAHLTLEQAIAICDFWKFNTLHTDFFLTLVNLARAGTELLKNKLEKELQKIRSDSLRGVSLKQTDASVILLEPNQSANYMLTWYISAIHAALSVQGLNNIKALAKRFSLTEERVLEVLKQLSEYNLVEEKDGVWEHKSLMALGGDTKPLIKIYHNTVRQHANHKHDTRVEQDYFTTNLMSLSRAQIPEIKTRLQNLVRSILEESQGCVEEELVFLTVDFFAP